MSEPPTSVTIIDESGEEDSAIATAVFDDPEEALDAVDTLLRFWAFTPEQDRHIRVRRE